MCLYTIFEKLLVGFFLFQIHATKNNKTVHGSFLIQTLKHYNLFFSPFDFCYIANVVTTLHETR